MRTKFLAIALLAVAASTPSWTQQWRQQSGAPHTQVSRPQYNQPAYREPSRPRYDERPAYREPSRPQYRQPAYREPSRPQYRQPEYRDYTPRSQTQTQYFPRNEAARSAQPSIRAPRPDMQLGRPVARPPMRSNIAPRVAAPIAAPQQHNVAPVARGNFQAQAQAQPQRPPEGQSSAPRQPASTPRPLVRGQGPHTGDWLRNGMRLPPQEQQKRLEQDQHFRQLPPQRQEQLRNRLQNFNSMPPDQRQRVLNRMEMMEHLRPEQQQQAQTLFGQFRALNPGRKDAMRQTLRQMRGMPPDARERMLNSPEMQSRYSQQEIQMLRGFNGIGFIGSDH